MSQKRSTLGSSSSAGRSLAVCCGPIGSCGLGQMCAARQGQALLKPTHIVGPHKVCCMVCCGANVQWSLPNQSQASQATSKRVGRAGRPNVLPSGCPAAGVLQSQGKHQIRTPGFLTAWPLLASSWQQAAVGEVDAAGRLCGEAASLFGTHIHASLHPSWNYSGAIASQSHLPACVCVCGGWGWGRTPPVHGLLSLKISGTLPGHNCNPAFRDSWHLGFSGHLSVLCQLERTAASHRVGQAGKVAT